MPYESVPPLAIIVAAVGAMGGVQALGNWMLYGKPKVRRRHPRPPPPPPCTPRTTALPGARGWGPRPEALDPQVLGAREGWGTGGGGGGSPHLRSGLRRSWASEPAGEEWSLTNPPHPLTPHGCRSPHPSRLAAHRAGQLRPHVGEARRGAEEGGAGGGRGGGGRSVASAALRRARRTARHALINRTLKEVGDLLTLPRELQEKGRGGCGGAQLSLAPGRRRTPMPEGRGRAAGTAALALAGALGVAAWAGDAGRGHAWVGRWDSAGPAVQERDWVLGAGEWPGELGAVGGALWEGGLLPRGVQVRVSHPAALPLDVEWRLVCLAPATGGAASSSGGRPRGGRELRDAEVAQLPSGGCVGGGGGRGGCPGRPSCASSCRCVAAAWRLRWGAVAGVPRGAPGTLSELCPPSAGCRWTFSPLRAPRSQPSSAG